MSANVYVAECVRQRGGSGIVYESRLEKLKCGGCRTEIRPGEHFSIGQFACDMPMCRDCEPYDVQGSLVDDLDAPTRGRSRHHPTHETVREYVGIDGKVRHRSQCPDCRGKGGEFFVVKSRKVGVEDKRSWQDCETCSGAGVVWPEGRAGVEMQE